MIKTCLLLVAAAIAADDVKTEFVEEGVTAKVGGYRPVRATIQESNEGVKTPPPGLSNPRYGKLTFGETSFLFVLDEPAGEEAQLIVDTNQDGDLTNDPETTWTPRTNDGLTMYSGSATVKLDDDKIGKVNLYRFDPTDPARAALKDVVLYYADFGTKLTLSLDDKDFVTFYAGDAEEGTSLWIDRDGNGNRSYKKETVVIGTPFNFTGTTYLLNTDGDRLTLSEAAEALPVMAMPPDLQVGKPALPFEMESLSGETIRFPEDFKGKLVMLDFWATWCGPCIAELPHVKEAYANWHDKGFEIVGISFDNEGQGEKVREFLVERKMPWDQIYEGKGWNTELGDQYDVSSIPFVLLVDGDSGEIVATRNELRGAGLSEFIGKKLAEKKSIQE